MFSSNITCSAVDPSRNLPTSDRPGIARRSVVFCLSSGCRKSSACRSGNATTALVAASLSRFSFGRDKTTLAFGCQIRPHPVRQTVRKNPRPRNDCDLTTTTTSVAVFHSGSVSEFQRQFSASLFH
ncbi:hypothetical protein Mapa_011652 [Marchantia paleacea]|nr:hypothetical protein Mapa_011652 [Marchantia paleacea]